MSEFPRLLFLAFVTVGLLRNAVPAAEDPSRADCDLVYLSVREPTPGAPNAGKGDDRPATFLHRELIRQAFLIAARDECGLLTRDAVIREEFPTALAARCASFELFCEVHRGKKDFDVHYELNRVQGKAKAKVWEWTHQCDFNTSVSITDLATIAEELSRGPLRSFLKNAGLNKAIPAPRKAGDVPAKAADEMWAWNEIDVLSALRRISTEIQNKGESPELLAGLAVGYANLSTLTEYYMSPACKAFGARALLYAERLVLEHKSSGWALWHRAYVRALIGVHRLAGHDVEAARDARAPASTSPPLPFWTDVIEAYCQGQLHKMHEAAKSKPQRALACYLNLLAVENADMGEVLMRAGEAAMKELPNCFRASDSLAWSGKLGIMRAVTMNSFQRCSDYLRTRLPEGFGVPESLAEDVRKFEKSGDTEEAIELRLRIVAELKKAGNRGGDRAEPSLCALGQSIEEISFVQLRQLLYMSQHMWGVSTDQTIAEFRPLCELHPYGHLVDSFGDRWNEQVQNSGKVLLKRIDPTQLGQRDTWTMGWLANIDKKRATDWMMVISCHADAVFGDEISGIVLGQAGNREQREYNSPFMKKAYLTSPKMPVVLAFQIRRNWKRFRLMADRIEKDYPDDPIVLWALSSMYLESKQLDKAERCAKQRLRTAPDFGAHYGLADVYKQKGDMKLWEATLEKAIGLPSAGLEEAGVHNDIAQYHMSRKEWKEALSHADAAADSYSEWGLETAAKCHEMLGDWDKAEALMRAISERYDSSAYQWMLWCHRTGHGDAAAAATPALHYFESLGTPAFPGGGYLLGVYYLLQNEPEKALVAFKNIIAKQYQPYPAMHAALIADALGQTSERDALFRKIIAEGQGKDPRTAAGLDGQIAAILLKSLSSGGLKAEDFQRLEMAIKVAAEQELPPNAEYFLGAFLNNRSNTAKSREYLLRAARSEAHHKLNHVLARKMLRDLKIPIDQPGSDSDGKKG